MERILIRFIVICRKPCRTWLASFVPRRILFGALEELEKLKDRVGDLSVEGSRLFNPGWHLAQDLKAMLTVSEAVTRSAIARQESRWGSQRIDHPHLDADWGTKNNVIVREGEAMAL